MELQCQCQFWSLVCFGESLLKVGTGTAWCPVPACAINFRDRDEASQEQACCVRARIENCWDTTVGIHLDIIPTCGTRNNRLLCCVLIHYRYSTLYRQPRSAVWHCSSRILESLQFFELHSIPDTGTVVRRLRKGTENGSAFARPVVRNWVIELFFALCNNVRIAAKLAKFGGGVG